MQQKKVKAQLDIKLTPEQVEQAAQLATNTMEELGRVEEDYSIYKREKNAEIKKMKLDIKNLCHQFATKTRRQEVDCEQFFDVEKRTTWFIYGDEKYGEREMTEDEIADVTQGKLFDDEEEEECDEEEEETDEDACDTFLKAVQ